MQPQDRGSIAPLHSSPQVRSRNCSLYQDFIDYWIAGSDVNRQDEDGRTPLMLACASDQDGRTVEYLIKHKADASVVDTKVIFQRF